MSVTRSRSVWIPVPARGARGEHLAQGIDRAVSQLGAGREVISVVTTPMANLGTTTGAVVSIVWREDATTTSSDAD